MADETRLDERKSAGLSRRDFVAAGLALSFTAMAARAAELGLVQTEVEVPTPDGMADAVLVHPAGVGPWPGVIVIPDAFGLRPATIEMAQRVAASGYTAIVHNIFYRAHVTTSPLTPTFSFSNPDDRARLTALTAPLTPEVQMRDSVALVAFLDAHPAVLKRSKIGVQGYCLGGPWVIRAAASAPDRIGAAAAFHPGVVVTDKPDSPHLLVPKIRAKSYFGIAANDDQRQPEQKTLLAEAYVAAGNRATIEVYDGAQHGWCMKDLPAIYNAAQAERAWTNVLALYKANLG